MNFTPYDDTQTQVREPDPTRNGYDTSGWDIYRQGVEVSTNKFRFMGSQPKFWSGDTRGFSSLVTYGQTPGVIDSNTLGLESKYEDLPKFNPTAYITLGVAYPMPILFNDGPSEKFEGSIEPLSIPFKKDSNEGPFYVHSMRAEIESGNVHGVVVRSAEVTEQFVDLVPSESTVFFLDEGADYFGNVPRDPFVADNLAALQPFDDTLPDSLGNNLQSTDPVLRMIARGNDSQDNDNLLPYGKKSTAAGASYYGPNAASYGTDSIAFAGWSLGS
jgi:hypothetical protein